MHNQLRACADTEADAQRARLIKDGWQVPRE
jgi:hypothetical protein